MDGMVSSGLSLTCLPVLRFYVSFEPRRILLRTSSEVIAEALQMSTAAFEEKKGQRGNCLESGGLKPLF